MTNTRARASTYAGDIDFLFDMITVIKVLVRDGIGSNDLFMVRFRRKEGASCLHLR